MMITVYRMSSTSSFIFLFLCAVPTYQLSRSQTKEETRIVLVNAVFRHGARTVEKPYANDPYKNKQYYPFAPGDLTNEGRMDAYRLGQYLRNRYDNFLDSIHSHHEIYVRSTDYLRSRKTAQVVLAGLFPPKDVQIWNEELLWLPIPVDYKEADYEDLLHPDFNCPYKERTYEDLPNRKEVRAKYIEPYKSIYEYIEKWSGENVTSPNNFAALNVVLRSEEDFGLELPEWTKSVYPEPINTIAGKACAYHNSDPMVEKINVGYLLDKMLNDIDSKLNGTSKMKLYLYSGHDSTLGFILSTITRSDSMSNPEYCSALMIELHEKNDKYFINIVYRNQPKENGSIVITIPNCDELCPLDKFKELYEYVLPTVPMKEACERT